MKIKHALQVGGVMEMNALASRLAMPALSLSLPSTAIAAA